MSTEEQAPDVRTQVTQRYQAPSQAADAVVRLVSDLQRAPVRVDGRIKQPIPFREALSVLHDIVQSDLRYKPKDRSVYVAFQRMRKRSVGMAQLQAQQAYFDWLSRNDPLAWFVLDPVVTVHPDGILFEVFSKDEGTYAQLRIGREALDVSGEWVCGTTNVDFSDALNQGVQKLRSYRSTRLTIGPEAVGLQTDGDSLVEKKIQVPDTWLRGFLQVQSSATLARAALRLSPIELYNVLYQLRMNADQKRQGRAIRCELVPGEPPRLVLEPWEWLLDTTAGPYQGKKPEVIRIWGRRRWMLLQRFLPFVDDVELHLIGSGLPSFLVMRAGPLSFTLGLTGFTAANWSRSLQFDTLLPRPGGSSALQEQVIGKLKERWATDWTELAQEIGAAPAEVLSVLQAAGQNGLVMFDLAAGKVRLRPLTVEPIDPARLEFRNDRERQAHDLQRAGNIVITKEEVIHGTGIALVAKAKVPAEKREYRPSFLLDDEGRVRKAECTCHHHRTHGLKEGPCAHLMALRLAHAELLAERARQGGGAIVTETRTYARRTPEGEAVTQISLDKRQLKVRWGMRTDARLRVQNLWFDHVDDAREAYLGRLERLEATGWLDATAT
ncbi:MAG TPA: SWIM zinc finger family protein [Deltaproteobacteria bacterium]|nr:SWIM zinc finger family protein [Deltaproteobacteria bacterium]